MPDHEGPREFADGSEPYSAPTMRVFGEGIIETMVDRARRVVDASGSRPGQHQVLDDPELPRLLRELGVAIWGYESAEPRRSRRGGDQVA